MMKLDKRPRTRKLKQTPPPVNTRPVRVGTQATRTAILDAAEALFAAAGYDGVPMREIAAAAKVPLGLLTYHFGSKERLFEDVVARRAGEVGERRKQALAMVSEQGALTAEKILAAFIHPYLELMVNGGDGWANYGRLIAYVAQSERRSALVARHFDDTASLFIDRLCIALPGLSRDMAIRGLVHVVSLMLNVFSSTRRLDTLTGNRLRSDNLVAAYEPMLRFAVGGITSLAAAKTQRGTVTPLKRRRR